MTCLEGLPYLVSIKWLARHRGLPAGLMRQPQPELGDGVSLLRRLAAFDDIAP